MSQPSTRTSKSSTKSTPARATRRPATSVKRVGAEPKRAPKESVEAPAPTPEKRSTAGFKLALTLALMAIVGGAAGFGTWSAFSSTTQNSGNTFEAGNVLIGDNDGGGTSPMLSFANASPGTTDTSCITVTYTGSLASSVRLYGTTGGSGLDQYVNLVVTRGSGAAGFDDCTGVTPDSVDHIGAGNGVVYSGTLQGFPDAYGSAIVDPVASSPEDWTNPESHQFRFAVTVQDNSNAQGLNASQSFTWEARNN